MSSEALVRLPVKWDRVWSDFGDSGARDAWAHQAPISGDSRTSLYCSLCSLFSTVHAVFVFNVREDRW